MSRKAAGSLYGAKQRPVGAISAASLTPDWAVEESRSRAGSARGRAPSVAGSTKSKSSVRSKASSAISKAHRKLMKVVGIGRRPQTKASAPPPDLESGSEDSGAESQRRSDHVHPDHGGEGSQSSGRGRGPASPRGKGKGKMDKKTARRLSAANLARVEEEAKKTVLTEKEIVEQRRKQLQQAKVFRPDVEGYGLFSKVKVQLDEAGDFDGDWWQGHWDPTLSKEGAAQIKQLEEQMMAEAARKAAASASDGAGYELDEVEGDDDDNKQLDGGSYKEELMKRASQRIQAIEIRQKKQRKSLFLKVARRQRRRSSSAAPSNASSDGGGGKEADGDGGGGEEPRRGRRGSDAEELDEIELRKRRTLKRYESNPHAYRFTPAGTLYRVKNAKPTEDETKYKDWWDDAK